MRALPIALLLAATLAGCASFDAIATQVPAPPPARPAAAEPEAPEPPPPPRPPLQKESAPPSPKPAPVPKEPPAPPKTAAIPREPAPSPPPLLSPQVSAAEEQRMKTDAERRIEGTERLVRQIDPTRLVGEQQENYLTIQSFLVKAKEALTARDVQRAFTLADKAYLLASELSRAGR